MATSSDELIHNYHSEKLNQYLDEHDISLAANKDEIIDQLMLGEFKDLGGVTAIRGFVYQYYVAMYNIIKMISNDDQVWWNKVVYEYFDDVALLSDSKIRFIQVKTVREHSDKKITPGKITYRSSVQKKEAKDEDFFNSWLDKLFLNYDYFLNENLKELPGFFEEGAFQNPQFELSTNSPINSLEDCEEYEYNSNFYIEKESKIADDNLFNNFLAGRKGNGKNIEPGDIFVNEPFFYMRRFRIKKFGSFESLEKDIINLIQEATDVPNIAQTSISHYIFKKLFSEIVTRTYRDDPELDKKRLVFLKEEFTNLFHTWKEEAKSIMKNYLDDEAILSTVEDTLKDLRNDYLKKFQNEKLRNEMLETLDWFNQKFHQQFHEDPKYCSVFLNKLFKLKSSVSVETFTDGDNPYFLKRSISYIIFLLVFYSGKEHTYEGSRLLFHVGHKNDEKLLFTVHNARKESNTKVVKSRVINALKHCEISSAINEDYFCLILDDEDDTQNGLDNVNSLLAEFSIGKSREDNTARLLDKPSNVIFINTQVVEKLFTELQEPSDLDSFETLRPRLIPLLPEREVEV